MEEFEQILAMEPYEIKPIKQSILINNRLNPSNL